MGRDKAGGGTGVPRMMIEQGGVAVKALLREAGATKREAAQTVHALAVLALKAGKVSTFPAFKAKTAKACTVCAASLLVAPASLNKALTATPPCSIIILGTPVPPPALSLPILAHFYPHISQPNPHRSQIYLHPAHM